MDLTLENIAYGGIVSFIGPHVVYNSTFLLCSIDCASS